MTSNDASTVRLPAAHLSMLPIVPTGPATGAVPGGALPLAGGSSR